MNVFSRKDRQLDPHVSVLLDDTCKGLFRPGSRITGTVTLQSPSQRHLHRAEATFFGHAETHCTRTGSMGTSYGILGRTDFSTNPTLKYHDDASLLRLTQQLCQTFVVAPNRLYTWPISFSFPHTASLIGPSPYVGATEFSGMYTNDRHLLPPSFERYFNSNHRAKVEYTIQATFQFADAPNALTIRLPPLDFLPVSRQPESSIFVEFVTPPEIMSNTALQGKKFFRRSKDKTSFSQQGINVVMKASLNSTVVKSSVLQIHACVEIEGTPQNLEYIQSIDLRVTPLKLREVTTFRGRLYSGGHAADEYQETGEQTFVLDAVRDRVSVEAHTQTPKNDGAIFFLATFEARIPDAAQPSFRTFNINHSFYLKGTVEAEIAGKKFEHKLTLDGLTVLP